MSDEVVNNVINALRKSDELPKWGSFYCELLITVLAGGDLRDSIVNIARKYAGDGFAQQIISHGSTKAGDDPMSACYVASNFPVLLQMAYKYADDPKAAMLASANAGGENVNRSAVLGALLGAAHGYDNLPRDFVEGLTASGALHAEMAEFLGKYFPAPQLHSEL